MEPVSLFSRLYSHPDKPLETHLINVTNLALKNLEETPIESLYLFDKGKITKVVRFCGLCHDLGKATRYFQDYLFSDETKQNQLKAMKETHHSLLSSVVSFFVTSKGFESDKDLNEEQKLFLSFIAYLSIKRHHGDLEDVLTESILDAEDKELLNKQIDSIDEEKFSILIDTLKNNGLNTDLNKAILKEGVLYTEEHFKKLRGIKGILRKLEDKGNIEIYLLTKTLVKYFVSGIGT